MGIVDNGICEQRLRTKSLDLQQAIEICKTAEATKQQTLLLSHHTKDHAAAEQVHKQREAEAWEVEVHRIQNTHGKEKKSKTTSAETAARDTNPETAQRTVANARTAANENTSPVYGDRQAGKTNEFIPQLRKACQKTVVRKGMQRTSTLGTA